jgi:hemerythrin
MEKFSWNSSLSVGVNEIDKDHQQLINLLNELIQIIDDEKGNDEVEVVLDELLGYTSWHFRHEERLMQTYGFNGFLDHKNKHADLIEQASGLQEKLKNEGESITIEVIDFLKDWLTKHILGTDMKLGQHLQTAM